MFKILEHLPYVHSVSDFCHFWLWLTEDIITQKCFLILVEYFERVLELCEKEMDEKNILMGYHRLFMAPLTFFLCSIDLTSIGLSTIYTSVLLCSSKFNTLHNNCHRHALSLHCDLMTTYFSCSSDFDVCLSVCQQFTSKWVSLLQCTVFQTLHCNC